VNRGIVAIGDSITAHCSPDLNVGGLESLSWAQRVAAHLDQLLTVHAEVGAASGYICGNLVPQVGDGYELALVFVGTNNVTSWRKWRQDDLAADMDVIVGRMSQAASRVLVMGFRANLGRARTVWPFGPGLGRRVAEGGALVRSAATKHGATFTTQPDLHGHEVWMDGVHPTSLGHYRMAQAALAALGEMALPDWQAEPMRGQYLSWRRREALKFAVKEPPRGIGKWLVGR
jgi:lysophospholipase L1-like esterase